jgi:hypothetical protein
MFLWELPKIPVSEPSTVPKPYRRTWDGSWFQLFHIFDSRFFQDGSGSGRFQYHNTYYGLYLHNSYGHTTMIDLTKIKS